MICTPWITRSELDACCQVPESSTTLQDQMITAASEILFNLSGRQFDQCTETVRPCSGGSALPGFSWDRWTYPSIPLKWGGTWLNIGPACGCHISTDCGCKGIPQVNLGRWDVTDIISVVIDGVILSPSAYRLDPGGLLVRTDGNLWPCCQDLSKDTSEEGTWYIELSHGQEVPESGKLAAGNYACELVKACVGEECAIPQRVTSLVRQGVSMTLLDPQEFLDNGLTGLPIVDSFIRAFNPNGLDRRATAWSPEVLGKGRRVGVLGS